ncbi:hypothetical protein SAMN02745947_02767 [Rhodococcus rhodochrous J3]|uniref:Integral membrane protein n=2 Tax=Rhodococcus rhodochrous TaxID=1829 RepID=A0AA47ABN1_RHORH|nr:hypothetical protein [Rhodococcus rhodochrous]AYA25336.1 hypothetical protein C6369_013180 [Rhodococcus rhodochrous]MBF4478481.1 hypothetical protein [Rhodococcus rhodochrous]TWH53164.1 hypothetical protein L612_000200004810 [Rhodococcus rhodochrous J38]UZF46100.1 hypothetical protein KUM34_005305 [Rhodococcus rhodochrous]SMG40070.1 hypothetical protein SAMN02745947_02767 [Rhodococcus rhodochrous J3]
MTIDTATGGDDLRPARLDEDERAELEQLRAEVATLRERAAPDTETVPGTRPARHGWRWAAVGLLTVMVGVLAVLSVTARFVRSEILDTDRYVTTVAPLSSNPAIQTQIANSVTDEIFTRVDVEGLTTDALVALTDAVPAAENAPRVDRAVEGLAPVITGQARTFVDETVLSLVQSEQFEDLWIQAHRGAHNALVAVVTGNVGPSSVTVDDSGTVSISLGAVIDNVKGRLLDRGFTFAEKIPSVDKQLVLFRSPELVRAQRAVNTLDNISDVLPWITLAAAAAAVAVAPAGRRLRALAFVGLVLVTGMFLLAVAIIVARSLYLDDVPPDVLSPDAAAAIIDTVLVPLRTSLRAVAALGLVIALGAYLTGGSASALTVRRGFGRGLDAVQRLRRPRPPNAFEEATFRARVAIRAVVIGVAALLVMFWRYPTGLVVAFIVLGAVLALLALELVIRPARTLENRPTTEDQPTT